MIIKNISNRTIWIQGKPVAIDGYYVSEDEKEIRSRIERNEVRQIDPEEEILLLTGHRPQGSVKKLIDDLKQAESKCQELKEKIREFSIWDTI